MVAVTNIAKHYKLYLNIIKYMRKLAQLNTELMTQSVNLFATTNRMLDFSG
jgi:hypothetical protein